MTDDTYIRLYSAVLYQAFEDLLCPHACEPSARDAARTDALAFFTARSGSWAKSRRDLCDMVGLNPDVIRAKIIAILEGADLVLPRLGQGRRDMGNTARDLEIARALWRQAQDPRRSTKQDTHDRSDLFESVLAALESGPMSSQGLRYKLSLGQSVVHDACIRLVAQKRLVQISKFSFALPATQTEPLVGRPTSITPTTPDEIDRDLAAAYEPEPIEVIRARSERILDELDAMRAA